MERNANNVDAATGGKDIFDNRGSTNSIQGAGGAAHLGGDREATLLGQGWPAGLFGVSLVPERVSPAILDFMPSKGTTVNMNSSPAPSASAAGIPIAAGLPMPDFKRIGVEPISGACGCEITGVDLRKPLDDATLKEVMKAFEQFLIIVFRDQNLTPDQHKAFSRYFGEITELPQAPTYDGHHDMQEVRREAHEPENVVPSFEHFHTDSPFLLTPPKCIVMRALEVPQWGGDTAFSNAYLVYEHLSDGMKALLDGLQVVYSGADIWSKNEKLPPEKRLRLRESHDFRADELTNIHPAVRIHPETGRKALFATTAYFKHFVGWSEAESRSLLNYLQGLTQHLHYHCRIKWRKDTLLVWDNRFTLHRGVHDFKYERRHLIRTTVKGERPLGPSDLKR